MPNFAYSLSKRPLVGPLNVIGNGSSGDFNKDGYVDLAYSTDISSCALPYQTPVALYVFNPSTSQYNPFSISIDGVDNSLPQVYFGRDIVIYDVNGDGVSDLIPIDASEIIPPVGSQATFLGAEQFAYISNGIGSYEKLSLDAGVVCAHGFGVISSADGKFRLLLNTPWSDYSSTGTAALIATYDLSLNSFQSELFTRHDPFFTQSPQNGWPGYFFQTTLDVNNDGNTDILGFSTEGGISNLYLNDGRGQFTYSKIIETGLSPRIFVEEVTSGDFNGDGYQDLVVLGVDRKLNPSTEFKSLRILINDRQGGLEDETSQWIQGEFQNKNFGFGYLETYDINSDGRSDFIFPYFDNETRKETSSVFISTGEYFERVNIHTNSFRAIPISNNQFITSNIYEENFFTLSAASVEVPNNPPVGAAYFNGGVAEYSVLIASKVNTHIFSTSLSQDFLLNPNVERLQFTDTNVALDIGPSQNAGSVYMLYKAAFNRAPDEGGMGYWLAQKDGGANIVTDIAQGFVNSGEFTAKYGTNPSNASYVDKLYLNVLGRAGEAGGVAYWNQELNAGNISKAAVLVQFATLAEGASLVADLIANGIAYEEWVG